MSVLIVIPSEPIFEYEKKGITWLEEYYNPNKYFEKVFILSPLEKSDREAYGVKVIPVKSNYHYKALVKTIKPDIIRAYGGYWASDFAIYNKISSIPVIVSVHDPNPSLIHKSIKFSDHIICMTNLVEKEIIIRKGINKNMTTILGNRVNTLLFRNCEKNTITKQIRSRYPEGEFILHIGRKSYEKNIETLLKSLEFLPKSFFIVFIGLGEKNDYIELAQKLLVDHRCFWIDSVENSELPYWYNACNLFCVLSRWEGFGLVFIEAAACEALILTSDIAPMNELLDTNSCFLIKEYEDPKKVAERILEIFSLDTITISKVKKNARIKSLIFDSKKISSKEIEIYKKVIKNGKKKDSLEYYLWKVWFKSVREYTKLKKEIKKHLKKFIRLFKPSLYQQ